MRSRSSSVQTECSCNHMTHFAVLFDYGGNLEVKSMSSLSPLIFFSDGISIHSRVMVNGLNPAVSAVFVRGESRGRVQRVCTPPPLPETTCGFLIQLVFTSGHQSVMPFLSGAPPPKKILDPPLDFHSLLHKLSTLLLAYQLTNCVPLLLKYLFYLPNSSI